MEVLTFAEAPRLEVRLVAEDEPRDEYGRILGSDGRWRYSNVNEVGQAKARKDLARELRVPTDV